jgi:hypothetical protein
VESDEHQILKLFEDRDRALIAPDIAQLSGIFADDYRDESGNSAQDVLSNLKSGKIRYISMTSTGRPVRLLSEDLALVHGWEETMVQPGRPTLPRALGLHGCSREAQRHVSDRHYGRS